MNKKQAIAALVVIAGAGVLAFYKQEPAPIPPEVNIDGHQFLLERQGRDSLHEYALTLNPGVAAIEDPEHLLQSHADKFCNHGLTPVLTPGWLTIWRESMSGNGEYRTIYRCKNQQQLNTGQEKIWYVGPFEPEPGSKR